MKRLQILGTGCPKCKKLTENAEAAAKALGIEKVKGVRCTEGQVNVVVAKAKETLADRK